MLKKLFFRTKIVISLLGVLAFVIAIFENATPVSIYFLSYEFVLPLSLWLLGAFLLGSLLVLSLLIMGWIPSRKHKEKSQDTHHPVASN